MCQNGPAGDAAFSCPANEAGMSPGAPDTGKAACDTCIEGCCGTEYCTCADDTTTDDAGMINGGCLGYVGCVQNCLFPPQDSGQDAGMLSDCINLCSGGNTTSGPVMEGNALLQCLQMSCGTSATCLQ